MNLNPKGPQQIVIAGREVKWDYETISYDQIVEEWNKLDPQRQIITTDSPGIYWKNEYQEATGDRIDEKGILYPGESKRVRDGIVFTVDNAHLT